MTKSIYSERYEKLRNSLIEHRKATGLTQMDVAHKLSRPQSYVSKYERGERRLDVVEFLDIAEVLGVNIAEVLKQLSDKKSATPRKRIT